VYGGTFDQLTDAVVCAAWVFYLFTVLGYFVLRRRNAARTDIFHAPGHPWLALSFVLFAAAFLAYAFIDSSNRVVIYFSRPEAPGAADGFYHLLVLAMIIVGIPVYVFLRRTPRDPPPTDDLTRDTAS
jgi:amino acid transporter